MNFHILSFRGGGGGGYVVTFILIEEQSLERGYFNLVILKLNVLRLS